MISAGQDGLIQLSELSHVLIRLLADVAPYVGMISCARNEEEMKIIKEECILNKGSCILGASPEWQVGRWYEDSCGAFSQLCVNIAYGGCNVDRPDIFISSKVSVRIIHH